MSDRELVVQTLVYAALDAVRMAMPLDLCACLHVVHGQGPQLYLRTPDLSSMDAGEAFDLFTALRDASDERDAGSTAPRRCRIAGFDAVAITTGERSRTVFVVGRADEPLTEHEADLAGGMCSAMGSACQALESHDGVRVARSASLQPSSVNVRLDDGVVHVDLSFPRPDGTVVHGSAKAESTTDAVALATIDALAPGHKLGEVTDGVVAGEHVVIVLLHDADGSATLGSAIVGGDPVRAAAAATAVAAIG